MNATIADKPMMDDREIEVLHDLIASRKPRRVLEWGAGSSTIYWTNMFPDIQWVSIEHNAGWFKAVRLAAPPHVILIRLDGPEYFEFKDHHLGKFDMIIVDGRTTARVRCLKRSHTMLTEHGFAILHDSHHQPYLVDNINWDRVTEISPPNDSRKHRRGLMLFEGPK